MNAQTLLMILFAMIAVTPSRATGDAAWTAVGSVQPSTLLARAVPFENNWWITETNHFAITFRAIDSADLDDIARAAERAYQRTASALGHQLSTRPLIVVYATRADLRRAVASRAFPGNREHLLWALDTPRRQSDGDFVHELVHVFTFDVVPVTVRRDLPTWLQEGFAELQRGKWDESDRRVVRELVRTKTLPALGTLSRDDSANAPAVQKVMGHLALDFIVTRAGPDAMKRILLALRENVSDPLDTCVAASGLSRPEFDRQLAQYVERRFAP